MAAVGTAGLQDVDPHRVELERLGEVEMARLGKGLHLLVEQAFQVVKRRIAFGQVAEARIARIALIAMLAAPRSEEHTSELESLMRISYAVFCLKKKNKHRLATNPPLIYLLTMYHKSHSR